MNKANDKYNYHYMRYERRIYKDSLNLLHKCEDESSDPSNFICCKF